MDLSVQWWYATIWQSAVELPVNPVCVCVSTLPLCFKGCLPAFASSPSLTLRRLWISLIIIACVTETWGGRYHPQEAFLDLTSYVCGCVFEWDILWIATAVLDSCSRGCIQRGHLPFSLLLKTYPRASHTQTIMSAAYHTHSHNYRVLCLHLKIYANSIWSPSRTVWEDGGNAIHGHTVLVCVCVFLLL